MSNDSEPEYELVERFVVVQSEGGPYEDEAFAAGAQYGAISAVLDMVLRFPNIPAAWFVVPTALMPQIDLLAMRKRFTVEQVQETDYYTNIQLTPIMEEEMQ